MRKSGGKKRNTSRGRVLARRTASRRRRASGIGDTAPADAAAEKADATEETDSAEVLDGEIVEEEKVSQYPRLRSVLPKKDLKGRDGSPPESGKPKKKSFTPKLPPLIEPADGNGGGSGKLEVAAEEEAEAAIVDKKKADAVELSGSIEDLDIDLDTPGDSVDEDTGPVETAVIDRTTAGDDDDTAPLGRPESEKARAKAPAPGPPLAKKAGDAVEKKAPKAVFPAPAAKSGDRKTAESAEGTKEKGGSREKERDAGRAKLPAAKAAALPPKRRDREKELSKDRESAPPKAVVDKPGSPSGKGAAKEPAKKKRDSEPVKAPAAKLAAKPEAKKSAKPEAKPEAKKAVMPGAKEKAKAKPAAKSAGPAVSKEKSAAVPKPVKAGSAAPMAVPAAGGSRKMLGVVGGAALLLLAAGIAYLAVENGKLRTQLNGFETQLDSVAEKAAAASAALEASEAEPAEEDVSSVDVVRAAMEEQFADVSKRLEAVEKRAKLTGYADEAISGGSRYAYNQLVKAYSDPAMVSYKSAANAEISRVESFFVSTASARYQEIPVTMVDPNLSNDTQLNSQQLAQVILASNVPPMGRARAAELLKSHREIEACDVLLACIKTEPNLVVLLEATRSFKDLTGYPSGEVFASRDLERWFEANRNTIETKLKAGTL